MREDVLAKFAASSLRRWIGVGMMTTHCRRAGDLCRADNPAATGVAVVPAGCRSGLLLAVPLYVEHHC